MTRLGRFLPLIVALLALSVRLLVPAGYMPERAAGGLALDICTGHGPVRIVPGGMPAKPAAGEASGVCGFAGLATPLLPALPPAVLAILVVVSIARAGSRRPLAPVAATLRLRPPLRGPPSF